MKIRAVILAADGGGRAQSGLPLTLHGLCGRPMVGWAMAAARGADANPVLVTGPGADADAAAGALGDSGARFAVQREQKGDGHALMAARELLGDAECILVIRGDMPLLLPETVEKLVGRITEEHRDAVVLCSVAQDPSGLPRVVRDGCGDVKAVVEHREATPAQREIREIGLPAYCFHRDLLLFALDRLTPGGRGEYRLADAVAIIANMGGKVACVGCEAGEGLAVGDRAQLADAAAALRGRINRAHMLGGVTLVDPAATYIDWDVTIGRDTVVYPGNVLEAGTSVGEGCVLYPNSRIVKSAIGSRVEIASSVITETVVGDGCHIGPFAYTRPGSRIGRGIKIGDFVEIKNSSIGDGTKISHLTYVGDADVGSGVNLGCGVVFVNYDGSRKHRTVVEDGAFIGCNTNLVAPVRVGKRGYTAAGSTITEDVPEDALAIARSRQTNKEGWVAKRREEEGK